MDNVNGINVEGFQNIGSNIYTGNKNNNSNLSAINTSNITTNKNIINQTNYEIETIDFLDVTNIEEKKEENSFLNELGKVGATVVVGTTSVISGILKLGEWIQDGGTWIKGTVTSGILDIVGADELAVDIRNKTQEEIARDQVGEINEFLYNQTSVGQAINEASYLKYDSEIAKSIQNISTEATKWVAATALTVGTAGLAAPVSAMLVFGTGAVQGIGKSAEQRYQDLNNSSYDTGAILLDGVGCGFSWYASGKLGQGAVGLTKVVSQSVSQTGVKGTVKFFKNMFGEKLKKLNLKNLFTKDFYKNTFKNGLFDFDQLIDSASMGVDNITSSINSKTEIDWKQISKEILLAYGLNCVFSGFTNLFSNNIKNVDATFKKGSYFDLDATEKVFFDPDATEKIFILNAATEKKFIGRNQRQIAALENFLRIIDTGTKSDEKAVNFLFNTFDESISKGNYETQLILEKFIKLKIENPKLHIELDIGNAAYWSWEENKLVIGKLDLEWLATGNMAHELGHCLYDSVLDGDLPENWATIIENAKVFSSNNNNLSQISEEFQIMRTTSYRKAETEYDKFLSSKNLTKEQYFENLKDAYESYLQNTNLKENLVDYMESNYYSEEIIELLKSENVTAEELAYAEINEQINKTKEKIELTEYSNYCAISDIIDAVYKGVQTDLNGNEFYTPYKHGSEYYEECEENLVFHEIIANFTDLKINGNKNALNKIKALFGETFYNILEETYAKFMS